MGDRRTEIVRGAWGVAGLTAPGRLLAATGGHPGDTRSRVVVRVLGARQLAQALLSGLAPTPAVLATGVWVDTVHALTAGGLAAVSPRYARPALADAAIASAWAALGVDDLRSVGRSEGEELRSALGRAFLARVPGGGSLLALADRARAASAVPSQGARRMPGWTESREITPVGPRRPGGA